MTWHGALSLIVELFWIVLALLILMFGAMNMVQIVKAAWRRRRVRKELHALDLQKIADLRAWGVNRWDGRR